VQPAASGRGLSVLCVLTLLVAGYVTSIRLTSEPRLAAVIADQERTVTVTPGMSLMSVLSRSAPGNEVLLSNGQYPMQRLDDLRLAGVTVRGESRHGVVLQGLFLEGVTGLTVSTMTVINSEDSTRSAVTVARGSRDLVFENLTIAPRVFSALDIRASTRHITLRDSTLTGWGVTGTRATDRTSRGVRINGAPYRDVEAWPTDIKVIGNSISGFGSDLIQIGGGNRVLVRDNYLHHPQDNDDHNDGVQSYGSNDLRIERNRFFAPGLNGPDQAIMLGHQRKVSALRVRRTDIVDNTISAWRGTGVNLAGTDDTRVVGNLATRTGNEIRRGSSLALSRTNTELVIVGNDFERIYTAHDRRTRVVGRDSGS
jgi:hypothetical protein